MNNLFSENLLFAFAVTLLAGLSTGIGSVIAYVAHKMNNSVISFLLGLSAGVMVYVSFVELFAESQHILSGLKGEKLGATYATLALFGGVALIWVIDFLVPEHENPHEIRTVEKQARVSESTENSPKKMKRLGIMAAIAIAIHNFPEGISTFITALESPSLGLAIAIAIALHNIPEGIAISIPIYQSTGSRRKAFWYSFLSGLAEPLGALLAYLILMPYINETSMGVILAIVAGIMIYVSIDELLPAARSYGKHHSSIMGFIVGMALMAFTLIVMV